MTHSSLLHQVISHRYFENWLVIINLSVHCLTSWCLILTFVHHMYSILWYMLEKVGMMLLTLFTLLHRIYLNRNTRFECLKEIGKYERQAVVNQWTVPINAVNVKEGKVVIFFCEKFNCWVEDLWTRFLSSSSSPVNVRSQLEKVLLCTVALCKQPRSLNYFCKVFIAKILLLL